MIGISNSLRHEFGMQGISIRRVEVQLTPATEFEFMTLCLRFLKEFETDLKLKKIDRKMSLNEYVARMFPKFLGGKKEEIEAKINSFAGLLDLYSQSQVLELYKWVFDINPRQNLILVHNKIVEKFKQLDPEFMDTPRKSLKNVSFPFKDMVDVVGKCIQYKSLRVFIENVEAGQKMKRGGIQDRKVPAVLLLKAALDAENECGGLSSEAPQSNAESDRFKYNPDKHNYTLKPKEEKVTTNPMTNYLVGKVAKETQEMLDPDEIPDVEDVLKNSEPILRKPVDEAKELTKIAHKYVFGYPQGVNQVRKLLNNEEEEATRAEDSRLSTEELLQKNVQELSKKHQEAMKRNEDINYLYELVIKDFNAYKQNYYIIGEEVEKINRLTGFFLKHFSDSPETVKMLKSIKNQDVIETKKLKLLLGKCFEKTSGDAVLDNQRVFKFAIDYKDYENDILKGRNDQVFELLQKSPPVPDQKGLRNARTKIRELREFENDSPVKDKALQRLMEGDDFKDIVAVLQSEYYAESRAALAKQSQQNLADTAVISLPPQPVDDVLLDYKIPASVLDGMCKLVFNRFYDGVMKSLKKRSKSRSSSGSKRSKKSKSAKSKGSSASKSKSAKKSGKSSRSPSKVSKRSKSSSKSKVKRKGAGKKKSGKSKSVKKTKKPKTNISDVTAESIDLPRAVPEVVRMPPLPLPERKKKVEPWREGDPVFKSPRSSRSKSVDRDIERLVTQKSREEELAQSSPRSKSSGKAAKLEEIKKKRIVKKKKKSTKTKSKSKGSKSKSKKSKGSRARSGSKASSKSKTTKKSTVKAPSAAGTKRTARDPSKENKPGIAAARKPVAGSKAASTTNSLAAKTALSKSPIPGKRMVGKYKS